MPPEYVRYHFPFPISLLKISPTPRFLSPLDQFRVVKTAGPEGFPQTALGQIGANRLNPRKRGADLAKWFESIAHFHRPTRQKEKR